MFYVLFVVPRLQGHIHSLTFIEQNSLTRGVFLNANYTSRNPQKEILVFLIILSCHLFFVPFKSCPSLLPPPENAGTGGSRMKKEGVVTPNPLGKNDFGGTEVPIIVFSFSATPAYQVHYNYIFKLSCTLQRDFKPEEASPKESHWGLHREKQPQIHREGVPLLFLYHPETFSMSFQQPDFTSPIILSLKKIFFR